MNNSAIFSPENLLDKRTAALVSIEQCRTELGFYASTGRYHQLWLRDLVYSEDVLMSAGYQTDVEKHLYEFIKLQQSSGQMPTVIDHSVSRLLPETYQRCAVDTEILFVIGMCKHAAVAGNRFFDENQKVVKDCVAFIESKLNADRLIPGMDWRDAMPVYVGKCLLANQMLLANMYELLGNIEASDTVRKSVAKLFYLENLGWYADNVYWESGELKQDDHFDSFGNALAVINGTASKEAYDGILRGLSAAKTPFGYRNIMPYYEFDREKALTTWYRECRVAFAVSFENRRNKYQNSTIWPFVEKRVVEALRKLLALQEAQEAARLLIERKGFNEFYDPETGAPEGSEGQLWTATAVVSAIDEIMSSSQTHDNASKP